MLVVARVIHCFHLFTNSFIDTNYNPKLWLQQYRAMFIKRYINFKRFHMGVIWQLLLPLLFVVMGLVLGGTINSNYASDPRRALMLSNSAPSTNLTLFHALFVDSKLPFSIEVSIHDNMIIILIHVSIH